MIITISATLTDEKVLLLAKEKWYQEVINNIPDILEIPNPETAGEFLKRVYENMIIEEVTTNFIRITDRGNMTLRQEEEKAIRDEVIASITSNVS